MECHDTVVATLCGVVLYEYRQGKGFLGDMF